MSTLGPCHPRLLNHPHQLPLIAAAIRGDGLDAHALTSELRAVPTALGATIPSSNIDNLSSEFHQDDGPFLDPALPSHGEFALFDHERKSAAATTNSVLASKRIPSKALLFDHLEPSICHNQCIEFLNCLEDKQETLRDAREALLGSRSRLQVQRRDLTTTREKAASLAGVAFNLLRQYLVATGINPPVDIQAALSEAEASRNALGTEEVDYDEAEKAYNFEEWRYTTKESPVIDELYGISPAPSQPNRSYPPLDKHDNPTRISFGPQDIANMVAESNGDPYLPTYSANMPLENGVGLSESQDSVPGDIYQPFPSSSNQDNYAMKNSSAYTARDLLFEGLAIGQSRLKWAGTLRYIDEWLLNSLVCSVLELSRLRYHSMVEDNLSYQEWRTLSEQHWFLETPEGYNFHTGDTTMSEESGSKTLSSDPMHRLFDVSDIAETETQQFRPTPLLAQDCIMDTMELANFPAYIEPLDLIDTSSKGVTLFDRSFSGYCESTHPTALLRESQPREATTTRSNSVMQKSGDPHKRTLSARRQHFKNYDTYFGPKSPDPWRGSVYD
jgi:hypothetical protein